MEKRKPTKTPIKPTVTEALNGNYKPLREVVSDYRSAFKWSDEKIRTFIADGLSQEQWRALLSEAGL